MSKFKDILNEVALKHGLIVEEGPTPEITQNIDPVTAQQPQDQPLVNDQPKTSALPDKADIAELNPQELMYIKLIYKALITDLDPSQYSDLIDIKNINGKNAKSVLDRLESIINNNTTIQ